MKLSKEQKEIVSSLVHIEEDQEAEQEIDLS